MLKCIVIDCIPTDIKPRILSTAIDLIDSTASLDIAMEVAHYFDLKNTHAKNIIKEIGSVVTSLR